jgi:hypothetical protein
LLLTGSLNWPVDFSALDKNAFLFPCANISASALRLEASHVSPFFFFLRAYGALVE